MDRFTIDNCSVGKVSPEIIQGLADILKQINNKITEAEQYAKSNGLEFSCDFGYGGGASYGLNPKSNADYLDIKYKKSDIQKDEDGYDVLYYWITSTQQCW
jgi:hypothetical protein